MRLSELMQQLERLKQSASCDPVIVVRVNHECRPTINAQFTNKEKNAIQIRHAGNMPIEGDEAQ